MNHLLRELAPVADAAWEAVSEEASTVLRQFLAARKIVDFVGPKGWDHHAEVIGEVAHINGNTIPGVETALRKVQPLVELKVPFTLSRTELANIDRGSKTADLSPVTEAARRLATAEDNAVFTGYSDAGISGIAQDSPHQPLDIGDNYEEYPSLVARAVAKLRTEGVAGPYAIALGPQCYQGVIETTQRGGYPVFEHLRKILGGPIVWAPAVNGAVIVSQRGGDYELVVGQDISIGYDSHDANSVTLYLEESMTFRNLAPEAGIALVH